MMRARWGRIINISSVVGETGNAGQANYSASKAGLIGLTKSLAQEMGGRGITVNAVAPGFVQTDMTGVLSDEMKEKLLANIPLAAHGRAEGRGGSREISGERRSRVHHRSRAGRERRVVYVTRSSAQRIHQQSESTPGLTAELRPEAEQHDVSFAVGHVEQSRPARNDSLARQPAAGQQIL